MTADRTLARITRQRRRYDVSAAALSAEMRTEIQTARAKGATWPEIAKAMGLTRQAVHNFLTSGKSLRPR